MSLTIKQVFSSEERRIAAGVINRAFLPRQKATKEDCLIVPLESADDLLSGFGKLLFVLCVADVIIGTVLLHIFPLTKNPCGYITHLAIEPNFCRRGYGKLLLDHVENEARITHKKEKIALNIFHHPKEPQKELEQWYLNQGYNFTRYQKLQQADALKIKEEYRERIQLKWFEKKLQCLI